MYGIIMERMFMERLSQRDYVEGMMDDGVKTSGGNQERITALMILNLQQLH